MVIGERHKHTDEGPIKTVRRSRGSRQSNGSVTEDLDLIEENSSGSEDDGGINVGDAYQASIPDCITDYDPLTITDSSYAILVWKPEHESMSAKVDEYINIAKKSHGYTDEQALALLTWHRHDIDAALSDLSVFTPRVDDWIVQDKVAFEQAFQSCGKYFHRIHQMLPDKSIASIVKYYYTWKKYRNAEVTNVSNKKNNVGSTAEENGSAGIDTDSDFENSSSSVISATNGGTTRQSATVFCAPIGSHASRSRPITAGPGKTAGGRFGTSSSSGGSQRTGNKCPSGLVVDRGSLTVLAGEAGEQMMKMLKKEVETLKNQVSTNKEFLHRQKQRLVSMEPFRPPVQTASDINPKWTMAEIQLAILGVERYGKDFEAIAETLGTKTEDHVRAFVYNFNSIYSLDAKAAESEHRNQSLVSSSTLPLYSTSQRSSSANKSSARTPHKRSAAGTLIAARPTMSSSNVSSSLHTPVVNQVSAFNQAAPTSLQMSLPPPLFRPAGRQ